MIELALSAHVVKSGHIYFIKTLTLSSCLPLSCLASWEAAHRFVLLTRGYLPFQINYAKMKEAPQPLRQLLILGYRDGLFVL